MASKRPIVVPNESKERLKFALGFAQSRLLGSGSNSTIHLLRTWLRTCEEKHDGKHRGSGNALTPLCQSLVEDGRGYPIFLIDIEKCCLVDFQPIMRYMAISYMWGADSAVHLKTEMANVDDLRRSGSLLGDAAVVNMPNTVADAMVLTGLLGVRYLWCDRFCIVQDDAVSKLAQIAQMAEIYARAYCTIIAYDSEHSNSGLNGLPMLSGKTERQLFEKWFTMETKWSTRGWTFQEDLFSTRKIKMGSKLISWRCGATTEKGLEYSNFNPYTSSNLPREPRGGLDIRISALRGHIHTGGLSHPLYPCLEFYRKLSSRYAHRALTLTEDVFHAFAGVTNALLPTYPGGFLQGLPVIHFDSCLLWQPQDPTFERRKPDIGAKLKPASWSWMGWRGHISWTRFLGAELPLTNQEWSRPLCLVLWSTSDEIDGPKTPILPNLDMSRFLRWEKLAEHESLPPEAQGWSRFKNESGQISYVHPEFWEASISTITGKLNKPILFGFPFPVTTSREMTEPNDYVNHPHNFLHGRVGTGFFKFSDLKAIEDFNGEPRKWVGQLASVITDRPVGVMVYPNNCGSPAIGDVIQVVVLSVDQFTVPDSYIYYRPVRDFWEELLFADSEKLSSVPTFDFAPDTDEMEVKSMKWDGKTFYPGDVYSYYNVLWVEMGHPAYRKGLGRIAGKAYAADYPFEANAVDITLG